MEFARVAYRISDENPFVSLKVNLARLPENYAFSDDNAFREGLESNDIYHKRVCFHLLDGLENHDSKELTDTSTYSIEHVLPQNENLNSGWRKMLGKQWRDIQHEWLNRLGNLTLTGYNSTYSDRSFEEKKKIKGGFAESSVRLNKFVREQDKWTGNEIRDRGQELARLALKAWPTLSVNQTLIDAAKLAELRDLASRKDVADVSMSTRARQLFEILRVKIQSIDPNAIEMAERRSVSYHGPTFFLEVLPRNNRILLLLALEFNEIEDSTGLIQDTSEWKYFTNAAYDTSVVVIAFDETNIDNAIPFIRKAHAIEMAERRSVSYHGPTFFLEVLPRNNRILLLLALEFNEIEDSTGLIQDTSEWKYFTNAAYDTSVVVIAFDETNIDNAIPFIRKAHALART